MKKSLFLSLSVVAMMMVAPVASAGYWTGHAELMRDLIEQWTSNHSDSSTRQAQPVKQTERTSNQRTHAQPSARTQR